MSRGRTLLLTLLLATGIVAAADAPRPPPGAEPTGPAPPPTAPPPRAERPSPSPAPTFTPSEKISADSAVAFPVDI